MPLDYRNNDAARSLDEQQLLDWIRGWQVVDPAGGSNAVSSGTGDFEYDIASGDINAGGTIVSATAQTVDFSADVDASDDKLALIYRDGNGDAQTAVGPAGTRDPAGEDVRSTHTPPAPTLYNTDGVVLAEVLLPAGASSIGGAETRDRRLSAELIAASAALNTATVNSTPTNPDDVTRKSDLDSLTLEDVRSVNNVLAGAIDADGNDLQNVGAVDIASLTATLAAALDADSNDITNVAELVATTATLTDGTVSTSPTADNDLVRKAYVDSVAQGLNWQEPVIDELNDPPGSPTTGDRYLINDAPTGAWSGHPNEIAEWDGSQWVFFVPDEGWAVFIEDIDLLKTFQSGDWVSFGSAIDHGNLAGLGDDDHPQYLKDDGTDSMSGALDMDDNPIANASEVNNDNYVEPQPTASAGTSYTADLSTGNYHKLTLTGDVTIDFSNVDATEVNSVVLHLVQDGTGGRTPSFSPTVHAAGGSAPSWSTAAGAEDVVTLMHDQDGSKWILFEGAFSLGAI